MNLLPKTHEEFSQVEYWNTFFKKFGEKSFEWYGEYPELCSILLKFIKIMDNVVIVGCGNSTLSMCLYDAGYSKYTTVGMSCPPKQFLEMPSIKSVSECITSDGDFILNLVSQDQNTKKKS